jgi:hypothetical protein
LLQTLNEPAAPPAARAIPEEPRRPRDQAGLQSCCGPRQAQTRD